MTKPNKKLSFKKIKKIYHEEVKQEPVVVEEVKQQEVLSEPVSVPIVEVKQEVKPVQIIEGTEDLVNEFLSAIGAKDLVEVVSAPMQPKVTVDASAFVDIAKLDDFLKNIQEEVPIAPAPIVEQTPPTQVTPVTKQVVDLTKPKTNKPKLDPNLKAINDRLGLFEKRLGDLAMRPMGQDPGGGETRLRFLDDVARDTIVDGWFLKYNGTTEKFEFASPSAASFNETDIRAVYAEVKNGDSVTIHKGDPVYLYRATGNKASVILAANTGDSTSAKTLGLAYSTFAPGQTGLVITKGTLTGVDTQMFAEGDTLYLGATAGTLTNVKPYSPNHLVYIGVVERANQGQGQIYVSPQNGYELDELHDVNINHHTPLADGHYLRWTAEHSQWINTPFPSLFSGSYNDLTDKPTIPSLTGYATESYVSTAISNVIGAAPDALNTLKEIADQLATDESAVSSLTTAVAGKVSLTGSYANPTWITSLAYGKLTGAPTNVSYFTNDSGYLTSVSWSQVTGKPDAILTLNDVNVISNDMLVNDSITIGSSAVALGSSITTLTGLTGVTSNHTTAFIAGANAASNVSLQMPSESALRNLTNGSTNMYFDVSIGGSSHGQFQFRSSSGYTNVLTMSPTGVTFNTDATVTARTPSVSRTAYNAAIDSEITVDSMRFRISNQGGIFPQVIGNGSSRNLAWTGVGAINGMAVTQVGSTGTIIASNAWTTLFNAHGMDSAGDTVTVTLQDKAAGRIYRITFMRSDNGSTTGYNIIGERLL